MALQFSPSQSSRYHVSVCDDEATNIVSMDTIRLFLETCK